jgi:hypothetical protein
MNRSQHYSRAEELAEEAVQVIARAARRPEPTVAQQVTQRREARDDAHLLLKQAMLHATLATAPADVEPERAMAAPPAGHPKPSPPRVMS